MKNIENSLLRPHADPIIIIRVCETCNGTGKIETFECDVTDCKKGEDECLDCPETKKQCGDCYGDGEVEIWK